MRRSHRRRRLVLALLLLLLLVSMGMLGWGRGPSSSLNAAIALRNELTQPNRPPRSSAAPRPRFQELRRAIDRLTPEARREFWADRRRQFRNWLEDFFRATPQEQAAILDSEKRRMREFRQRETAGGPDAQGPTWTNGLSAEELQRREKLWLDLTTAEERALVDTYFQMLSQQPGGGQPGSPSPWGNCPT
jgi:hypothetical protein